MRGFSGLAGGVSFLLVAGTIAFPAAAATAVTGTARAGAAAQSADLYVNDGSQSCSDSGPGTQATPFCTIQAAANVVNPGQTVYIVTQPGGPSYYESVTIRRSGTPSAPITFARLGQEPIPEITPTTQSVPLTLQGVHDVNFYFVGVTHYDNENGVDVVGSRDITLDRMFIDQSGSFSAVSAGIAIDGASSDVTVSRTQISGDYGYGIQVQPGATGVTATTNDIGMSGGTGISVQGATGAAVTSNSVYLDCGTDVSMTGGSAAVAENNVLNASWSSTASCPAGGAALTADSSSARTVRADYNGLYARAPSTEYSWAGTAYSRAADFSAATGQGTHDLDLTWQQTVVRPPVEGSPIIDSADCTAPGELATDILGNPHAKDPEVSDTGKGTCYADRGAYERQDAVGTNFTVTPSSRQGVAPLNAGVTLTSSPATSPWGEPVSYTVDFGDGSGPRPVAPDGTVTHTYTTPGLYTLTVTAADTGGSKNSYQRQMVVGTETAPRVTLGAGPYTFNGLGGPSISAGAASFTISAGADAWELASGTISFGDGTSKAMGTFLNWTHLYPHPGTYTATLTETDLLGRLSTASATVTVGDEFTPVGPYQDYSHSVAAHGTVRLSMAALNANYSDIRAAYVTVTVTGPKEAGFVTVYPNGSAIPKEAAVQFSVGHAASNTALAVPGGQTVDFYNGSGGSVNLTVDTYALEVTSTLTDGTDGDTYAPDGPVRLLPATNVAGGGHVTLTVAGTHGVPAKADAVLLDVTASGTKAAGYLSAYPDRAADPGIHAADWAAGQMVTGLATVPLQDGKVVLRNGSKGSAVFTADVAGYFNYYGTGSVFLPSAPLRLLDVKIGPGRTTTLRISGKGGLPASGISAAAVNLTASGAARAGTIVGWADKTARPNATSLSYSAGASAATRASSRSAPTASSTCTTTGLAPSRWSWT